MIPGTFFQWDDQSAISAIPTEAAADVAAKPLFAAVITSDKGEENWTKLSGRDWFRMYTIGDAVDFARHGQPLLQTAMAINSGAEILCKRVVADDACLANLAVVGKMTVEQEQETDADGNPLYWTTDPETGERTKTTEVTDEPSMIDVNRVKYVLKSAQGCNTRDEVITSIRESVDLDNADIEDDMQKYYLLWIIFDNGRGTSKKRFRITPNFTLSKNNQNYFIYDLDAMENNTAFTTVHFALTPDIVVNGENISLQYACNTKSDQLKAYQCPEDIRKFMDISVSCMPVGATGNPYAMDLLFGNDKKGKHVGWDVDTSTGADLQLDVGNLLLNGDNGSFGDVPIAAPTYAAQVAMAFAGYVANGDTGSFSILTEKQGCYDPIIYNVDRYRIDAIFDANYPRIVKRAIEELCEYREDCFFFRDLGTSVNTLDNILDEEYFNAKTKFAGSYCTYYDIIDPYSKKQITVTIMYDLIQKMVNQFATGRNKPIAGIQFNFVLDNALEGTVGFTPTVCPGLNQKEELNDARVNYATYIDNQLVLETLYTSQEPYTQLSFINNILAVQQVIKEVRRRCPAIRYSFIDGDDLTTYRSKINDIIDPFRSNFKELTVSYMQDPYYTQNKIFYAALGVRFRDFEQTEYFKITALSNDTSAEASNS